MQAFVQWVNGYVINSVWQVLVLALCTWVLVRVTARGGARLHARLWVGCLLLCVLLPAMPKVTLPDWHWHRAETTEQQVKRAAAQPAGPTAAEQIAIYTDQMVAPVRTSWVGRAIFWVYGLTVLVAVVKLLRELAATWAVVRRARTMDLPQPLEAELERACGVFGVGEVEVRSSVDVRSPATVSWPRAMLLVPEDFVALPEADAAAAFGHELAHVRRGDFWVNVMCEVASVAAWWHPAMHWVKRRVSETREVVCDEMAAEATMGRAAYARSLVSLAENAAKGSES